MFKIKIKENKALPIEEQIVIIKNIIKGKQYNYQGLCFCFQEELLKKGYIINNREGYPKEKHYIPLFCYKNALLHGNAHIIINNIQYKHWWLNFDNNKRLKFLEWMLKKLNKQLNKQLKTK